MNTGRINQVAILREQLTSEETSRTIRTTPPKQDHRYWSSRLKQQQFAWDIQGSDARQLSLGRLMHRSSSAISPPRVSDSELRHISLYRSGWINHPDFKAKERVPANRGIEPVNPIISLRRNWRPNETGKKLEFRTTRQRHRSAAREEIRAPQRSPTCFQQAADRRVATRSLDQKFSSDARVASSHCSPPAEALWGLMRAVFPFPRTGCPYVNAFICVWLLRYFTLSKNFDHLKELNPNLRAIFSCSRATPVTQKVIATKNLDRQFIFVYFAHKRKNAWEHMPWRTKLRRWGSYHILQSYSSMVNNTVHVLWQQ